MAVIVTPNASVLKIKFDCGVDENSNLVYKTKSYGSLKHDAKNEDVIAIANALVSLQTNSLEAITKVDNTSLSE
ncbi:MAG: DUF1659 domain-containing protein [Sarcina sp.]